MKKAGVLVASVAAASSMALAAPSSSSEADRHRVLFSSYCDRHQEVLEGPEPASGKGTGGPAPSRGSPEDDDRFAPRFDGLRFIETLVTAHR